MFPSVLGSTLLRRLYGRIDHMENLFKIELNQVRYFFFVIINMICIVVIIFNRCMRNCVTKLKRISGNVTDNGDEQIPRSCKMVQTTPKVFMATSSPTGKIGKGRKLAIRTRGARRIGSKVMKGTPHQWVTIIDYFIH